MILILKEVFSLYHYLFVHMLLLERKFMTRKYFFFQIVIDCPAAGIEQTFLCDQWLADDEGDGCIMRTLFETKNMRKSRKQSESLFSPNLFQSLSRQECLVLSYSTFYQWYISWCFAELFFQLFILRLFKALLANFTNLEDIAYFGPLKVRRKSLPSNHLPPLVRCIP